MENPEWKKAHLSLAGAALFAIICIGAFSFMDGMSGGYAIAFGAFFLALCGIAVSPLFLRRAQAMDAILEGKGVFAHWSYPLHMIRETAEREYHDYRERNRAMFLLIGRMLVAVALFFLVFVSDGGVATGTFLLGFALLLFIISRITPGLARRRALRAPPDAYIAQNGIIFEGAVYPFRSFMMKLDGISFQKASGKHQPALVFSFTQMIGLLIVQPFDIVVPVPAGEEDNAGKIAGLLGGEVRGA